MGLISLSVDIQRVQSLVLPDNSKHVSTQLYIRNRLVGGREGRPQRNPSYFSSQVPRQNQALLAISFLQTSHDNHSTDQESVSYFSTIRNKETLYVSPSQLQRSV